MIKLNCKYKSVIKWSIKTLNVYRPLYSMLSSAHFHSFCDMYVCSIWWFACFVDECLCVRCLKLNQNVLLILGSHNARHATACWLAVAFIIMMIISIVVGAVVSIIQPGEYLDRFKDIASRFYRASLLNCVRDVSSRNDIGYAAKCWSCKESGRPRGKPSESATIDGYLSVFAAAHMTLPTLQWKLGINIFTTFLPKPMCVMLLGECVGIRC